VDDAELRDLYRRATAVLMPAEEDFGIVPVEAMACGRPVVALGRGGACESVVPGVTGLLVDDASPDAFADAMAATSHERFDSAVIRQHAERFGIDRFESGFRAVLADSLATATAEAGC
jgi:glycosyltransferase involved in cell wall biosynthesis